jgi:hypothetical protein
LVPENERLEPKTFQFEEISLVINSKDKILSFFKESVIVLVLITRGDSRERYSRMNDKIRTLSKSVTLFIKEIKFFKYKGTPSGVHLRQKFPVFAGVMTPIRI